MSNIKKIESVELEADYGNEEVRVAQFPAFCLRELGSTIQIKSMRGKLGK